MQSRVVWELCRVGSRWGARCGETLLGGRRCSVGGHRLPPCSSFSSPPSAAPKPSRKTTSVSYILFLFFKYAFTGLRRFVYTGSHISLALPFSVVCVSFSPAFTICIKLPSRHYIYQQHFFLLWWVYHCWCLWHADILFFTFLPSIFYWYLIGPFWMHYSILSLHYSYHDIPVWCLTYIIYAVVMHIHIYKYSSILSLQP